MKRVVMVEGSPHVVTFRARLACGRCVTAPGWKERHPFFSDFLPGPRFLLQEAAWLFGVIFASLV